MDRVKDPILQAAEERGAEAHQTIRDLLRPYVGKELTEKTVRIVAITEEARVKVRYIADAHSRKGQEEVPVEQEEPVAPLTPQKVWPFTAEQ